MSTTPAEGVEPDESFTDFLRRREASSGAFLRGDTAPLEALLSDQTASFMPPDGRIVTGARAVRDAQVTSAAAFGPTSTGHFEVIAAGSSGDLGFWTGRQVTELDIRGRGMTPMTLRTTEVFRRENGSWRLVHRHADAQPDQTQADQTQADPGATPASER